MDHYAELVAIGTIGDIVPLEGDNRILVKQGLSRLTHTDQVGLRALLEEAGFLGKDLSAGNVAYSIVPDVYKRQVSGSVLDVFSPRLHPQGRH